MGIGYREIIPLINTLNKLDGKDDISLCELGNNYLKGDEMIPWLESEGYNFTIGGEQHPTGVVSKSFWNRPACGPGWGWPEGPKRAQKTSKIV